jgi:isocitrate dehydrogenase (NAD+)
MKNIIYKQNKQTLIKKYLSSNNNNTGNANQNYKVTLFRGDGIGPEISQSVIEIFKASKVPIEWEEHQIYSTAVTNEGDLISKESLESIIINKVALKGPFETKIGKGHRSLNVTLRKKLKLYANVRPVKTISSIKTVYEDVDLVTIRENTEGEYSGLEHEVIPGVVENLKIITEEACQRIAQFAFSYANIHNRKSVCAAHKAGVQ